tara:strand:+ start:177 stop:491 length:315 start_codon:yes stop_codon:yes gene_type:complete
MKINKIPTEYKRGDLVRHKLFDYSDDIGEIGIVIDIEKREHPLRLSQKELFTWIKVYMVVEKRILTLAVDAICKVEKNGTEWYEVGLGGSKTLSCEEDTMLYIE